MSVAHENLILRQGRHVHRPRLKTAIPSTLAHTVVIRSCRYPEFNSFDRQLTTIPVLKLTVEWMPAWQRKAKAASSADTILVKSGATANLTNNFNHMEVRGFIPPGSPAFVATSRPSARSEREPAA